MPAPAASRPRHGGIRKHQQQRRDRDGDVSMGATPRTAPVRPAQRKDNNSGPRASSTPSFVELKVTGWTDEKEMTKLISFLERHSSRRSTKASRGPVPPKMIKRHRVVGQVLTISVRQEDVTPFGKINGFTFASTHGNQKLNISGPGIRSKSPTTTTADGQDQSMGGAEGSNAKDKPNTVELLKGFLQRRYDPNSKLLNFSSIASDEEVLKSGMFDTLSTQKKFFPALMVVCGQLLKTAEEKKAAVESVTLSNNNLPNLDVVRDLSVELPHIINLDISGNKFETLSVLKPWKNRFRHLEQLIVDPFTTSGWEEELTAWFPKLQKLNGIVVRAEQAPAAAAATVAPIPPATTEPAATGSALTPQQEEMVVYVQRETKLKREMAIQCLVAAEWNLEKAAELFKTANLTPDAFE